MSTAERITSRARKAMEHAWGMECGRMCLGNSQQSNWLEKTVHVGSGAREAWRSSQGSESGGHGCQGKEFGLL